MPESNGLYVVLKGDTMRNDEDPPDHGQLMDDEGLLPARAERVVAHALVEWS